MKEEAKKIIKLENTETVQVNLYLMWGGERNQGRALVRIVCQRASGILVHTRNVFRLVLQSLQHGLGKFILGWRMLDWVQPGSRSPNVNGFRIKRIKHAGAQQKWGRLWCWQIIRSKDDSVHFRRFNEMELSRKERFNSKIERFSIVVEAWTLH